MIVLLFGGTGVSYADADDFAHWAIHPKGKAMSACFASVVG
jgi:hypothetical protein